MTTSEFTTLSDQATLIANSADMSKPVLPITTGNARIIQEFLVQEPKSDVRVEFRGGVYAVKRIFDEGIGLMFELQEMCQAPQAQTQNCSMTILMQEDCEFDVRTVNGFRLFIEQMGGEVIS
ncbi:hypothetical protein SM033_00290 [Vibrio phage vB_VpaM_sm033]|nr:hypothetical protein SM033_00290 [Vibrio phage vB_VpaM_sm033]